VYILCEPGDWSIGRPGNSILGVHPSNEMNKIGYREFSTISIYIV
jgi:hypothetical protein